MDEAGGLVPALTRLAEAAGANFSAAEQVPLFDPHVARTLWFACAEGLANAGKHAQGSAVSVALEVRAADASEVMVTIHDNGPGGADLRGAGLAGLAERVSSAGGSLHVSSGRTGTSVCALVPVRDDVVPLMPVPAADATVEA